MSDCLNALCIAVNPAAAAAVAGRVGVAANKSKKRLLR